MGLIAKVGRRDARTLVLLLGITGILTLGGISMVVPFMLMLSGSTKTAVDQTDFDLVPSFLRSDEALYRKYVAGLFNESLPTIRASYALDVKTFDEITLPEIDMDELREWRAFSEAHAFLPQERAPGFVYAPESRILPHNLQAWTRELRGRFDNDLEAMNEALGAEFVNWNAVLITPRDTRSRRGILSERGWEQAVRDWGALRPMDEQIVHSLSGYFHERMVVPEGGRDTPRRSLNPTVPDAGDASRERWLRFVREEVHPAFVRVDRQEQAAWIAFLQERHGSVHILNEVHAATYEEFSDAPLPESWPDRPGLRADWLAFLQGWKGHAVSPDSLRLSGWEFAWQGDNMLQMDHAERFLAKKEQWRWVFLTQNHTAVQDVLVRQGRGVINTVIYCTLSVLLALIVNPLAAYALSRFRPRNTYALLLFLLLTMAFPPMVTQIPVFLMLRDFGLLNTFWALLLPGLAHGYSIFLLKGFFDSLPKELYESASLDGAGEIRMFWTITLSLSKPILAVVALSAFVNAYTNFMFALLICQDERMWTLMVWLYQLQQSKGVGIMNAAFLLAALPTLVVFLLCQKQIMRGIVVPVEK